MASIPLNEVAFRCDLGILLGVSEDYVTKLLNPPKGERGAWYRAIRFPSPFHVSPSGVRVWFVRDIEQWCRSVRLKETSLRRKRIGMMLDRPEIVERLLGI